MKRTAVVLAIAATAMAAPTIGSGSGTCSTQQTLVCCSGLLGGILCNINILGTNCVGGTYCCSANAVQTGLVNIGGCNKIL